MADPDAPTPSERAETPEEWRARVGSVGQIGGSFGPPKKVDLPDGTTVEREMVRHEYNGGVAGWHDHKPDGTTHSTITPEIPHGPAIPGDPT